MQIVYSEWTLRACYVEHIFWRYSKLREYLFNYLICSIKKADMCVNVYYNANNVTRE